MPTRTMAETLVDLDALTEAAYELRPLPASAARLAQLLATGNSDLRQIADIIQFDPPMAARLLRAANSAAQGVTVHIATISDAVFRLGSAQVLSLAVASHAKPLLQQPVSGYNLSEHQLWRHSVAAAIAAESAPIVCRVPVPPESFAAALLHDIGKLLMGRFFNRELMAMLKRAQTEGGEAPFEAERQLLQVHHGEIGGLVAQHWNLPEPIAKGIIHHHTPSECDDPICDVVYLANLAAKGIESLVAGQPIAIAPDPNVLSRLGAEPNALEKLCQTATARFQEIANRYRAA